LVQLVVLLLSTRATEDSGIVDWGCRRNCRLYKLKNNLFWHSCEFVFWRRVHRLFPSRTHC
jgi:hypothetical protein